MNEKRTEMKHKIDFALFDIIEVDKYMAIVGYMITCFFTFRIALDRSQKWQIIGPIQVHHIILAPFFQ